MNKKVDERVFNGVKALLKSGTKRKDIAEYMQVSAWTISKIAQSETLKEYRTVMEQRKLERQASREKPCEPDSWVAQAVDMDNNPGGTTAMNYQFNRLAGLIQAQNELLETISNKLAFVVEMLS